MSEVEEYERPLRLRKEMPDFTLVYPDSSEDVASAALLALLKEQAFFRGDEFASARAERVYKRLVGESGKGGFSLAIYRRPVSFALSPENVGYDVHFSAELEEGDLSIDALMRTITQDGDIDRFPRMPRLKEMVGVALRFFGDLGHEVKGITGSWSANNFKLGTNGIEYPSSNWLELQSQMAKGLAKEEAALLTPTGKVALYYGYSEVEVRSYDESGATFVFRKPKSI